MPHTWDIVMALFRPARRGGELLLLVLLRAALFTWRSALLGFLIGSAVGFGLGVLFVRSSLAERGLMPYVVASPTVPILAIAPILVVWAGRLNVTRWLVVAVVSAYLAFFPVAINTLRGLRSPEANAAELMRSYAAAPNQVLWKAPGAGRPAISVSCAQDRRHRLGHRSDRRGAARQHAGRAGSGHTELRLGLLGRSRQTVRLDPGGGIGGDWIRGSRGDRRADGRSAGPPARERGGRG